MEDENEKKIYQNLRDEAEEVLRGKIVFVNDYIKIEERSQSKNLNSHLKKLQKQSKLNLNQAERRK